MNFLTLCYGASPDPLSGVSISALFSSVATYASELNTSLLSCHLLMTASAFEDSRGDAPRDKFVSMGINKIPWEVVQTCPRSDILVACKPTPLNEHLDLRLTNGEACLSSCVLSVKHLENLRTCTAVEIWDYLKDVLLLILAGHYVGDEAPLSLLVAPTLCEALLTLLGQTRDRLGNQFLSLEDQ
jgi:hypothetical protein